MLEPGEQRRLLGSLAAGDRGAAERLVEETYHQVYAALFKLCRDEETAADLTQETYRKAWRSLATFDGRAQLSTWLYRIAYNTFLNHLRRPRLLQPLDEVQAAAVVDPAPDPASDAAAHEEAERLRRAVLALPEELRYAVTAHYWGEVPVREIARTQAVTTVAVRKRLKRAFRLVRLALEEELA